MGSGVDLLRLKYYEKQIQKSDSGEERYHTVEAVASLNQDTLVTRVLLVLYGMQKLSKQIFSSTQQKWPSRFPWYNK